MDYRALEQLHEEQKDLLDTIDGLRKHGLYYPLDLPKIVVVGDQSSGKSSLLESISGFRFSAKDGLYTRFATELILCTNSRQTIDVQIQSSATPGEETVYPWSKVVDKDSVSQIIEEFEPMILKDGACFSEDVLKIKISGPNVPRLTLVDLPGFHPSEDDSQPDAYREIVNRLVDRYMTCKNNIILAVIAASEEFIKPDVTSTIQRCERLKAQTIGVLTKVDLLAPDSTREHSYISLAKNNPTSHKLLLGWHFIRNRGAAESSDTEGQRDEKERSVFESSFWPSVPPKNCGVEMLRKKLSGILFSYTKNNLLSLVESIEKKVNDHKAQLEQLGEPRLTPKEQRMYLDKITARFHTLCLYAVEGNYNDQFFGGLFIDEETPTNDSRIRKLRALIRDLNRSFAYVLETKGSRRTILSKTSNESQHNPTDPETEASLPISLKALVSQYEFEDPKVVSFEDVTEDLERLSSTYQSDEFPGTLNDRLAISLFRDQSRPWESIARRHTQLMLTVTKAFVEKLLAHVTNPDEKTYSAILSQIVDPFFDQKFSVLESKLQELLYHYKSGHTQPHDAEFRNILGRKRRRSLDPDVLGDLIASRPDFFTQEARQEVEKMGRSAASSSLRVHELIHKAETCYEMSLRTFADNVVTLAIENCLVKDLPLIMTTARFSQMGDSEIEQLASEAPEIQEKRMKLQVQCGAFAKGLQVCNKYRLRKFTSVSSILHELEKEPSTRVENASTARIEATPTTRVGITSTATAEGPFTISESKGKASGSLAHPPAVEAQSNTQKAPNAVAEPKKGNNPFVTNPFAANPFITNPNIVQSLFALPSRSLLPAKRPSEMKQTGSNSSSGPGFTFFGTPSTPAGTAMTPSGSLLFNHQNTFGVGSYNWKQTPQALFGNVNVYKTDANSQGLPKPVNQSIITPPKYYWSPIKSETAPQWVSLPLEFPKNAGAEVDAFLHICFQPPYVQYSPEELRCMALAAKPVAPHMGF
ncbi:P-loop containing nucleoside triphosphate hydrolase protein [Hypoxylon sp. NC0597]|nr:P-loop containing nucleoside triphosphate hydrolase protein [Hypoxylon sp. NC0597]